MEKGVQISSNVHCDPETTHVVAQKMSRSEKMLGSIASGKNNFIKWNAKQC